MGAYFRRGSSGLTKRRTHISFLALFHNKGGETVGELIHVTDGNFDDVIVRSEVPSMVDLWAPWCAPCRMIGPWIEELALKYDGKFKAAKMNVDENPNTPNKYGVRAIPTVLFFKDGALEDTIVGAVGKANIEKVMLRLMG
jgi:thioredoxin 1